jgi:hypothetical protein
LDTEKSEKLQNSSKNTFAISILAKDGAICNGYITKSPFSKNKYYNENSAKPVYSE